MHKFLMTAGLLLAVAAPTAAMAQTSSDMVCLITFGSAAEAAAGADSTALSGVYLTREEAEAQAAASGGVSAVFDYSTQYPNNTDEQAFCEGPTFNPDDGDDNEAANPNSAKEYAPGQLKGKGESAKEYAPGQQDGDAKDSAPGQQKKNGN
ncbi:MAG: hypothetical protein EON57_07725 [Alphaproteobacteria bacterium]|nr:MAG: hypothetical protein EON57_07725 [Alphaproteobacteria bacterium]